MKKREKEAAEKVTKEMAYQKAISIMSDVGIREPEKRFNQYPHEFSGGMRQRIVIAIAIAANPEILICDEPTTALDVTIQAQILELINEIKEKRKISILFITHDLGVVANMIFPPNFSLRKERFEGRKNYYEYCLEKKAKQKENGKSPMRKILLIVGAQALSCP